MSMAACGVVLLAGAALDGPCGVSGKGGGCLRCVEGWACFDDGYDHLWLAGDGGLVVFNGVLL